VLAGGFSFAAIPHYSGAGGFALNQDGVPLVPGQNYVLSGFIYTGEAASGAAYLDLNDVSWEVTALVPIGVSQWQFVYETFTAGANTATIRLVRDGNMDWPSRVYFDEVAVTPLGSFIPVSAVPVPEPSTYLAGLTALGMLGLSAWRNRK